MNTDVTAKMGRRPRREVLAHGQEEHPLYGAETDEQRSRRPIFAVTLRAEGLLNLFFVARRSRIHADTLPPRFANKSKIPLSVGVHGFSTGC